MRINDSALRITNQTMIGKYITEERELASILNILPINVFCIPYRVVITVIGLIGTM